MIDITKYENIITAKECPELIANYQFIEYANGGITLCEEDYQLDKVFKNDKDFNSILLKTIEKQTINEIVIEQLDMKDIDENILTLTRKLNFASTNIACESRLGPATTILVNQEIYDKYISKWEIKTLEVVINENVGDEIYVYRKGEDELQGGLFLLYNGDNYTLAEISNVTPKMFTKIELY